MAKKVCAVTGGRGFMARHLVAALLRSGEWSVRITDLAPVAALEPEEKEGLLGAALRDGIAVYASADVCDLALLTKAFEGVDVVFHTAAADPVNNSFKLHYKVNVEGTKNVIDACKTCKVKRLIYTSSSAVVFDGVHGLFGVDESIPYPDKFIIGDGKNSDDFVYVENVVNGHICAERTLTTKSGAARSGGKAYFITNMEPMNMWRFIYIVLEELGFKRLRRW
ncbi:hypothetical protein BRADI_3g18240v3 [Brachypodium distachyon]|uniref:3-beta hydroxysteroid dehydrogenase/isomerase domain-containing protein n=1 Tax=Brachypodium distachyon TaxID=15368 RepID=A0A0Q3FBP5_BRADI|nr:hypothetical protein BRADI_3g18240v3 [Brachypodium distachyon]